ncbi:hypothetical protein BGZ74_009882 [Mortierella antarctica]|nr:hypothetical protein BGZ74_009882 [Mortierella antarctica]
MATTLQEKFALLQQMKKEKELKDAKAKDTKKFDIFSIAGVALPGASGTAGPRSNTGQGPGGAKAGQGGSRRLSTSRQISLDTSTKPPTPVSRTSSSTSLKRGHVETTSAPESVPESDEQATATTSTSAISGKNPQLLSPTRSPPGVDNERVTPETDKSGVQECPPKKLKRSSMAVRSERQALERRPSSSGSMDYAPEQANRLGSPTRDIRGAYPRTDRKYSTDYTDSPGGDSSSVSSMPLTPTPSPLHVEDFNTRTSKDGGAYIRPDVVDIRDNGYRHHNPVAMEAHRRGRYHHHQDAMAYNKAGGYDCGSQSPARSGSLSPSRSRSRSPMVMSPPHRKSSFSMSMSMSPPHTNVQNAPRPKVTAPPRVIHQLPPRPRSPKLPPEGDVSGGTVSARVMPGALVSPRSLDPRAAAASTNNVRRQILSYDDL